MTWYHVLRYIVRRWWWRHFHPFVRWGWVTMKLDTRNESHQLTNIGMALVAAGFASRFIGKREHLYSGALEPGQQMRIVVERRGVRTERLVEG